METCICKYCKKIFNSTTVRKVCDACTAEDNATFLVIEEYLHKYPNSNAMQIADGTGIQIKEILRYVDEGRLQVAKGSFEPLG